MTRDRRQLCVTISLPCHGFSGGLRRAVDSILSQTYPHFTLVVINDGGDSLVELLSDIHDPRLTYFDLPENRGRYFADAVVLNATTNPYLMIQDADDWSEPQRLERLLRTIRAAHAGAAVSATRCFRGLQTDGKSNIESYPHPDMPLPDTFKHRANHQGLFRVDALKSVGGNYGGFRIGYDTLLLNLLLMTTGVSYVNDVLYNRHYHAKSLTQSPETGLNSGIRKHVRIQLRQMYYRIHQKYLEYLSFRIRHHELCSFIRKVCAENITREQNTALQRETERLKKAFDSRHYEARHISIPNSVSEQTAFTGVQELPIDDWTISPDLQKYLREYLSHMRPKRLLDVGSGISTVLLAEYAATNDAHLISLEHDEKYGRRTSQMLQSRGLSDCVDLRIAPLKKITCKDDYSYPWYDTQVDGEFDFVFIDGPPERYGRQAAIFRVYPYLHDNSVVWVHDGHRQHERECLALWKSTFDLRCSLTTIDEKGMFRIRKNPDSDETPDTSLIGVSILTGGRLQLLKRTISSVLNKIPSLLRENYVTVLVNGDDPETRDYVEQLPFVNERIISMNERISIGKATSKLMNSLFRNSNSRFYLHLEDDWEAQDVSTEWFRQAISILNNHSEIGQVRLRHISDRVLRRHMITKKPICWTQQTGWKASRSCHFTFNPSLIRSEVAAMIYPCRDEREAQEKFLKTGLGTAQLIPGVFRHIGDNLSLRTKQGNRLCPVT